MFACIVTALSTAQFFRGNLELLSLYWDDFSAETAIVGK